MKSMPNRLQRHSKKIWELDGLVTKVEDLGEKAFKIRIKSARIANSSLPGNFVHIRVGNLYQPLWRRAFSIYDVDKKQNTFDIVFKVVGLGTNLLSLKQPGDTLNILGPLGNTFHLKPEKDQHLFLLAGGLGIVPLYFLAGYLKQKKFSTEKIHFLYGARTKKELYCLKDTQDLKTKFYPSTDDGSSGFKGRISELLLKILQDQNLPHDKIKLFACGPEVMLDKISDISRQCKLDCQISLERPMPCGMGTCMGCVVRYKLTNAGFTYKRTCWEGPVFNSGEVDLKCL